MVLHVKLLKLSSATCFAEMILWRVLTYQWDAEGFKQNQIYLSEAADISGKADGV